MNYSFLIVLTGMIAVLLNGQTMYPDSAVVVGYSHHVYATGEAPGNRVTVRDSFGNIHAVFCYVRALPFADSAGIYYVLSTNNGFNWSIPENISLCDSQSSEEPNLAIDSRNRLHCVWKQFYYDTLTAYHDYDMYYSRKDSAGWTSPINISNQSYGANACYSSMVVDSRDYIHVIWDMSTGSGNWDIFYCYFNDTIWSVPYQVSNSPNDDAFPALAIDKNDNLHVVWRQRTSNGPIYHSYFDGTSWTPPEIIASIPNSQSGGSCVVVDSLNNPHVVFNNAFMPNDSSEVYYLFFDGSVWTTPINLSNTVHPSWGASLAIDSQDRLYLVWTEKVDSNPDADFEVYYRTKDNIGWSTAFNISQDTITSNCAKLGNPVWLDRIDLIWVSGSYNPPGSYDIVYLGMNSSTMLEQRKNDISTALVTAQPNPFRSGTEIKYSINHEMIAGEKYNIRIYDVSGRIVKSAIANGLQCRGKYYWSGEDNNGGMLPPGIYFIYWEGGGSRAAIKTVKLK